MNTFSRLKLTLVKRSPLLVGGFVAFALIVGAFIAPTVNAVSMKPYDFFGQGKSWKTELTNEPIEAWDYMAVFLGGPSSGGSLTPTSNLSCSTSADIQDQPVVGIFAENLVSMTSGDDTTAKKFYNLSSASFTTKATTLFTTLAQTNGKGNPCGVAADLIENLGLKPKTCADTSYEGACGSSENVGKAANVDALIKGCSALWIDNMKYTLDSTQSKALFKEHLLSLNKTEVEKVHKAAFKSNPPSDTTCAKAFDEAKLGEAIVKKIDEEVKALCKDDAESLSIIKDLNADKKANVWANKDKGCKEAIASLETGGGGESTTSCAVEKIGWVICPAMDFMAKVVDQAYNYISSLLKFQPLTGSDSSEPIYKAWSTVRNFANAAFVIAFMIIIYAQITGAGISNYGIKKLLPRLLIAAVLVNASFWICAIAVDLSNITGGAARDLFRVETTTGNLFSGVDNDGFATGSSGWSTMTQVVLGGAAVGAALYIGLSALLPALIAALAAIVTVFLVLTLRQALLVLLIVISPLAFVAFLLPNTQDWFKKWRLLFQTLLLMFPIIGFIFGASAVASKIVMASAPDDQYTMAIQIMGALISILPLAITPVVMKTAGGVLNRFGGVVNNPNKGPFDRMRKGAGNVRERQQNRRAIRARVGGRVVGGGQFGRKAKKEQMDASLKRERGRLEQSYGAEEAIHNKGYGKKLAGAGPLGGGADAGAITRAIESAQFTIDKVEAEEVQAAKVSFNRAGVDSKLAETNLKQAGTTTAQRMALREIIVEAGDAGQISTLWNDSGNMEQGERNGLADSLRKNKPSGIGQGAISGMQAPVESDASGNVIPKATFEQSIASGIVAGRYDANGTASADSSELEITHKVLSGAAGYEGLMAGALKQHNDRNPGQTKTIETVKAQVKKDATVVIDDHRFSPGKSTAAVEQLRNI